MVVVVVMVVIVMIVVVVVAVVLHVCIRSPPPAQYPITFHSPARSYFTILTELTSSRKYHVAGINHDIPTRRVLVQKLTANLIG
jgi:hypothetical protein